jgi:hypothetical protein
MGLISGYAMTEDTVTQLSKVNQLSKRYKQAKDNTFGIDSMIRCVCTQLSINDPIRTAYRFPHL